MSDLLQLVVSEGSSDLHIRVGVPPVIRVHGTLHRVDGPPMKPEDTEELMRSITSEDHIQHVREQGGADYGFAFGDRALRPLVRSAFPAFPRRRRWPRRWPDRVN